MEALWLVHNGIPFEVAFNLGPVDSAAWAIIFSSFHGQKYDFDRGRFVEVSP